MKELRVTKDGSSLVGVPDEVTPAPSYKDERSGRYPGIESQLDMMYWDAINGTTLWKDMITKIKTDIPK